MTKGDEVMESKTISIIIGQPMLDEVKVWADYTESTLSAMVRFLVKLGLDQLKKQDTIRPPNEDHAH